MKQLLGLTQHFCLLATSFIASSVLVVSPSLAATFATSRGTIVLTDFSHSPFMASTYAEANTLAVSTGGSVVSQANAIASFANTPTIAFNLTSSEAAGKNQAYLGLAESKATVRGLFNIEENSWVSFNFAANLNLQTSVNNPQTENASATGKLFFALVDLNLNQGLDYFQLTGKLSTEGKEDFLNFQSINNVNLNSQFVDSQQDLNHRDKISTAYFDGYVKRYFTNETKLALISYNFNEVKVTTSEPATVMGLCFSFGMIVFLLKYSRKGNTFICLKIKR